MSCLEDSLVDSSDRKKQTSSQNANSPLLADVKIDPANHTDCIPELKAMPKPSPYLKSLQALEVDISALEKQVNCMINQQYDEVFRIHSESL